MRRSARHGLVDAGRSQGNAPSSSGEQLAECERRAIDDVPLRERDGGGERWPVVDKRVILAALAAWIDRLRQLRRETGVDLPAAPRRGQTLAVGADDHRMPAVGDELAEQL